MSESIEQPAEGAERGGSEAGLTAPSLFTLDYLPVPPELARYVTTFYHFRCDEPEIRDVQPAAIGHLIVFLAGQGVIRFADGRHDPSQPIALLTPANAAAVFEVAGPFHCIGAALSPLGWAALTGLHAGRWADRMLAARDVLGPPADALARHLIADYRQPGAAAGDLCARLGDFVASRLQPVNPRHQALIETVIAWLSQAMDPPLADLLAASAYSPRQTQRLVERYFGLSPRELKRKYRALRVVALMNEPSISEDELEQLAECFYDQSHMIREIRRFAGRTPGQLTGGDGSILSALLDLRNFREIEARVPPLPELAPHENDSQ